MACIGLIRQQETTCKNTIELTCAQTKH